MVKKSKIKNTKLKIVSKLCLFLTTNNQILTANFGFTLIELLIVIAIIAGLASIFVATYPSAQRRARDTQRKSDIKQYQTALELYANKNNGSFPVFSGQASNTSFCQTTLGLPSCPDDPQGLNPYQVRSDTSQYVVWARLEQPPSPVTYFVVCSTGEAAESTTASGPACPL